MKCLKRRFESQAEAEAHLNVLGPQLHDFSMAAYACPWCRFWHVGHRSPEQKNVGMIRSNIARLEAKLHAASKPAKIKKYTAQLMTLRALLSEQLAQIEEPA